MEERDFSYRNLIVWQKAMAFSQLVYSLVRSFPAEERFALSDQIRRAVVSIASNIAEGCGRASNRDYAHFLSIARGSLYETMTQLEMARAFGYIDSLSEVELSAKEIARMLGALMKTARLCALLHITQTMTTQVKSHLPLTSAEAENMKFISLTKAMTASLSIQLTL